MAEFVDKNDHRDDENEGEEVLEDELEERHFLKNFSITNNKAPPLPLLGEEGI
jgi:hypothetical protein